MKSRRRLYTSIAAATSMLLAGLVLAPGVVTAGFNPASKKADVATPPLTDAKINAKAPKIAYETPETPLALPQPGATSGGEGSAPRSDLPGDNNGSHEAGSQGFGGETTFALSDFAPAPLTRGEFLRSGSGGFAVASADTGSHISKFSHKPKPTGNGSATDTGPGAPGDDDSAPADITPGTSTGSPTGDNSGIGPTDHQQIASTDPILDGEKPGVDPTNTLLPGTDGTPTRPTVSVPEPTSLGLLFAGAIGLVLARRRAA